MIWLSYYIIRLRHIILSTILGWGVFTLPVQVPPEWWREVPHRAWVSGFICGNTWTWVGFGKVRLWLSYSTVPISCPHILMSVYVLYIHTHTHYTQRPTYLSQKTDPTFYMGFTYYVWTCSWDALPVKHIMHGNKDIPWFGSPRHKPFHWLREPPVI